jgi:predicted transcriptional regulator
MSDSKTFEPFTDLLSKSFEPGTIHVTTILNLDAAMWGTSGFVISELQKNKRIHPLATMVLDENGSGVTVWDLGEAGTGLVVTDAAGVVKYFTRQAMTADEMAAALALVRSGISS